MTESINSFSVINNANADEAYDRVLPEAKAVRPESLLVINLDVMAAVFTAMGAIEKLAPFMEPFKQLLGFPFEQVAKLRDYVLAMYTAQLRYTFATTPPEQIPVTLQKATACRDILIADTKALIARGLLDADLLKELTGVHGYRNVAVDLSGLCTILKGRWAEFEGKIGLTREELAKADQLALELAAAVAHREQSPEIIAEVADTRQRVFTLFYDAYDQARRGVSYLRWNEGDADTFVPSLYAGRVATKAVKKQTDDANAKSEATGEPVAKPVPTGHPGGDPLAVA